MVGGGGSDKDRMSLLYPPTVIICRHIILDYTARAHTPRARVPAQTVKQQPASSHKLGHEIYSEQQFLRVKFQA
jgi:hypothetical protein